MGMNLNLGSSCPRGIYKTKEWVNVDITRSRGVNVIGDGFQLPFKDNTFERVHSVHVLEHLDRDKWPLMLEEIYRVTKVNGVAYIEVPDFQRQIDIMSKLLKGEDRWQQHLMRTAIWGKTERKGMGHQFGFDWPLLNRALKIVGFDVVKKLTSNEDMISNHFKDGPVLLALCSKELVKDKKSHLKDLSFDELRKTILW